MMINRDREVRQYPYQLHNALVGDPYHTPKRNGLKIRNALRKRDLVQSMICYLATPMASRAKNPKKI